jgi:hypothetical protein
LANGKFPIDQLNSFLERYPGLEELIEEFEHLSMAKEDDDRDAIAYFKRQQMLREGSATTGNYGGIELRTRDTNGIRLKQDSIA